MPGLHELKPPAGSNRKVRRRGRGDSAGQGSYSGRGHKGQRKRGSVRPTFEGGQLPMVKRLPYMRGFYNPFRVEYTAVNLERLSAFEANSEVTPETLRAAGLLRGRQELVKLLGVGSMDRPLKVTVHAASKSAREKIEAAGGSLTLILAAEAETATEGDKA